MLDWGLAVEALNKVDAGVPEKVSKLGGMGWLVWCAMVQCATCEAAGSIKPSGGTAGLAQQLLGRVSRHSLYTTNQPACPQSTLHPSGPADEPG